MAGSTRGGWAVLGSPEVASALATSGLDWVCLDAQHGLFDRAALHATLRSRRPGWADVLVRVSALDEAAIGFALDAGASTVIVPMVETREQAERAARAVHYPPRGARSWGPVAPLWGATATAAGRCWIMVETPAALARLDELLSTPGVDGVFVGPFDLALALGVELDELLADRHDDAPLARIARVAHDHALAVGAFAGTPARGELLRAAGFDHVAIATDAGLLDAGIRSVVGSRAPRQGY